VIFGDLIAAASMVAAGLVEAWLGVSAEQESLEDVAEPLSAEEGGEEETRPRRHRGVPSSPGQFARALRTARSRGRVVRTGRDRWVAA
jgi:hypothetical protein